MTNTDDRSLIATIAGNVAVDDWAGLARRIAEWVYWGDGASRGDGSCDEFERVIESSTVNCICGMISGAFATLEDRRGDVSNRESASRMVLTRS